MKYLEFLRLYDLNNEYNIQPRCFKVDQVMDALDIFLKAMESDTYTE